MSPYWMVPVLVLTLGGVTIAFAVRQACDALRDLGREVDRLGEIAVAAAMVGDEARRTPALLRRPRP